MRCQGSAEELERVRRLAVRRVLDGRSAAEVARFLGLHERTVRKWLNCYETKGADALAAKPPHGAKPKLTPDQEAEILSWFARNPTEVEFGFPTELWTGVRAAQLVQARMGVKMNSNYLIKWLRDRGITSQMVRRRARGHNEEEMARWQREEWPRILKNAAEFAAKIIMIDETGILMRPLVRRSLAPRGNPMVMRYHSKHREKVSVQGALVLSSEGEPQALRCQMHVDSYVDGEKTAAFLRKLLREWEEPLIVVWDRGNMHKGPHIRALLEEFPRLTLEQFPAYCPDLNPIEWFWSWIKYCELVNFCPWNLRHLTSAVANSLIRGAENKTMQQNFVRAAGLTTTAEFERPLAA